MSSLDIDCLGLELSASGIEQARLKTPQARFVQTDLLQSQSPSAELDHWGTVATCSEVLEHVDQPAVLLRNACAYLTTGAILVVTGSRRPPVCLRPPHRASAPFHPRPSLEQTLVSAGLEPLRLQAAGFPFFDLYRLAVFARGKRLIEDAQHPGAVTSGASGAALHVFDRLFRANLDNSPLGWQLVAVARLSRGTGERRLDPSRTG